jgi:hypothetical protein
VATVQNPDYTVLYPLLNYGKILLKAQFNDYNRATYNLERGDLGSLLVQVYINKIGETVKWAPLFGLFEEQQKGINKILITHRQIANHRLWRKVGVLPCGTIHLESGGTLSALYV